MQLRMQNFSSRIFDLSLLYLHLRLPLFLTTLEHIWQELSTISLSSILRLQCVPGHSFLRVGTRPISWPLNVRCFTRLQLLVVSLSLSLSSNSCIHSSLLLVRLRTVAPFLLFSVYPLSSTLLQTQSSFELFSL